MIPGTDLPGRCPKCGLAPEPAQGHRSQVDGVKTGCEDSGPLGLILGLKLAEQGMARTVAAHPDDAAIVDAAIDAACKVGRPFSANDFRHLTSRVEQPKVIGARIRAWAASKRIQRIGDVPSTDAATHAHRIGLYMPTP